MARPSVDEAFDVVSQTEVLKDMTLVIALADAAGMILRQAEMRAYPDNKMQRSLERAISAARGAVIQAKKRRERAERRLRLLEFPGEE